MLEDPIEERQNGVTFSECTFLYSVLLEKTGFLLATFELYSTRSEDKIKSIRLGRGG